MKRSAMLWAYVLFFYLICITNAENAKVLVKMGTQKCLSKCTFEPTGTDRYFDCSVYGKVNLLLYVLLTNLPQYSDLSST